MNFEKLLSRKFILSILVIILIVLNKKLGLGLDQEAIYSVIGIIGTYVIGQGIADAGNKGNKIDKSINNNNVKNDDSKKILEE